MKFQAKNNNKEKIRENNIIKNPGKQHISNMAEQQQPNALAGLDEDKMKLVQDLEIEMMTDMYSRLSTACQKKVNCYFMSRFTLQKAKNF